MDPFRPRFAGTIALFNRLRQLNRKTQVAIVAVPLASLFLLGAGVATTDSPVLSRAVARTKQFVGVGNDMSIDDFSKGIAQVYCEALMQCNPQPELDARSTYGGFSAQCHLEWENRFREETMAGMDDAIAAGTFAYNGTSAEACLEKIRSLGCRMFDVSVFETCTTTFVGKSEGACSASYECPTGQRCEVENSCPGSCVPLSQDGQPCRNAGDCAGGLFCSEKSATCEPLSDKGEPCDPGAGEFQCVEGSYCKDKTCVPFEKLYTGKEGDACSETARCADGLSCTLDVDGNVCKKLAKPGGECLAGFPSHCPKGHFCTAALGLGVPVGKCEPLRKEGKACARTSDCEQSLTCAEGLCRKLSPVGGACDSNADCWSNTCSGKKCAPKDPCQGKGPELAQKSSR